MKEIITHDGQFHADEVVTIALLLRYFGTVPIRRTRKVTLEELEDPDIWILDQYNRYEPAKHNFDHHQDRALTATNVLVLDYLREKEILSEDIHLLLRRPFAGISDYDTKGPLPFNGFQFSELIKTLNNLDDGFNIALSICKLWLESVEALINKKEHALKIYKNGRSIEKLIKVCSEYPILWTTMGSEKILVCQEKGHWKVHSPNEDYPIVSTGKETFLHANKFIAAYVNKQDAVEAAKLTARIQSNTPLM